ncbi:exopolysaccharide biosynthesis polyprenyl glycosylphosphotransferase [Chryseobacterium sp.]|uniref:exopolysaccharide biosynthesis polyprenyl glycosylphosphotransferase n=1 Tax=Chryseobacterium sp. TaxID=1871047 RepID=UPI0038906191
MQRFRYSVYLKSIIIVLDLLVIAFLFIFFYNSRNPKLVYNQDIIAEIFFSIMLVSLFWMLLSTKTTIYNVHRNLTYTLFLEKLIVHLLLFNLGVLLIGKVSRNIFFNSDIYWLCSYLLFFSTLLKSTIYFIIKYFRSVGINNRNIMFLGENSSTRVLKNILLERKDYGYKIFQYPNTTIIPSELVEFWKKNGIHKLFIGIENNFDEKTESQIFKLAEDHKVKLSFIPNVAQNDFFLFDFSYIQTQPILDQAKYPLDFYYNYLFKRAIDIIFSLLILIFICSWLFPIISLIIRKTSSGSIFFVQKRYGYREEIFKCLKFRTMIENDLSSSATTCDEDPRITPFGKFLRKTSLDEMPQFINVLKGEMSVVGPRPHMLSVDDYYKPKIGRYSLRSLVKPGITGLAQVNGLRGDKGDVELNMNKRILADSFYVKNWSFVLDFIIILKTIFLLGKGDKNAT